MRMRKGRSRQEDCRVAAVQRAGKKRRASGAGVLRGEDLCVPRRSLRSVSATNQKGRQRQPSISMVTITAPNRARHLPSDSPSRRRVLICTPRRHDEEAACARKIISTLARRAYRRPVTDDDLQVPLASYRDGASRGGFESGIEMAIRSILVSPDFLFRIESQPAGVAPNTPYRVSDLDLASRLSFFLWSSIPDERAVDSGREERPAQARSAAAAGAPDARGSAFAGAGGQFRRPVASHPQCGRAPAESGNAVPLRRQPAQGVRAARRSCSSKASSARIAASSTCWMPTTRFSTSGWPSTTAFRACSASDFRRVSLPPDSPRRGLLGQGLDSDGDVLSESDVAGHPREVDPGEHFRRAAATAAAERARAEGRARPAEGAADARAAGRAPRQSRVRGLPCADGPVGVRARELRRDRRVERYLHVRRAG